MGESERCLTLPQMLEKAVELQPDREAVYDRTRRLTYRELQQESDRLAGALAARGIQKRRSRRRLFAELA